MPISYEIKVGMVLGLFVFLLVLLYLPETDIEKHARNLSRENKERLKKFFEASYLEQNDYLLKVIKEDFSKEKNSETIALLQAILAIDKGNEFVMNLLWSMYLDARPR
ncbi:hypothetical protein BR63_09730 [Thermanaerosceptrum fracticalcis]|uniref:Uncharacterized protein n=1 Tax=Thermanaerosceptrum fracticalcis TaxID=1712410 RepID=A0A7G6E3A8_THEFR|nr:hypothetical protein [Thermanaerosceptrum fracticalcis]QNB46562.1 hypothetical protein BR63_09730 [Thermanaerosceptrum fracticalcis]